MSDYTIGLWGTAHAGKTTYLTMLYQAFLADADQWEIHADEASRHFVEKAYEQIYREQIFPDKTVVSTSFQYTVTLKKELLFADDKIPQGTTFTLHFEDAAGELFEAYYDRSQRNSIINVEQRTTLGDKTDKKPIEIFQHLAECKAIIILVDPARTTRDTDHNTIDDERKFVPQDTTAYNYQRTYRELLFQLFEDLRQHHRDQQTQLPYVAFCLTKADANDHLWSAMQRTTDNGNLSLTHTSEQDVVEHHLGKVFFQRQLPGLISTDKVSGFLISSIGRLDDDRPNISTGHTWQRQHTPSPPTFNHLSTSSDLPSTINRATIVPTYRPQSIFNPDEISPKNLINPILWLLLQLQNEGKQAEQVNTTGNDEETTSTDKTSESVDADTATD